MPDLFRYPFMAIGYEWFSATNLNIEFNQLRIDGSFTTGPRLGGRGDDCPTLALYFKLLLFPGQECACAGMTK